MKTIYFSIALSSILFTSPAWAEKTVGSIDQVPNAINQQSNLKHFTEQMSGQSEQPKMPGSLSCESLNQLFGYPPIKKEMNHGDIDYTNQNNENISVNCEAKPYGNAKDDHWVVTLVRETNYINSTDSIAYTYNINLAIISDSLHPKILATTKPLSFTNDVGLTLSLNRLDMGNYDLGKLGKAIGLRVNLDSCGAGGSTCNDENLMLFVEKNNSLQLVFDNQIGYFDQSGGDWHQDGTRDHSVSEQPGVLLVQKDPASKTGIPNLIITYQHKKQTFVWNVQTEKFTTHDKPILESVIDPTDLKEITKSWS